MRIKTLLCCGCPLYCIQWNLQFSGHLSTLLLCTGGVFDRAADHQGSSRSREMHLFDL